MVTKSHLSLLSQEKSNHNPTIWVGAKSLWQALGKWGAVQAEGEERAAGKKEKRIIPKQSY